jgi:hypothetical protein
LTVGAVTPLDAQNAPGQLLAGGAKKYKTRHRKMFAPKSATSR